ncbi:hypothetical protein [Nocardioides sp.]|uniref:hypothetical protein n=1 Tax=Nocardioides sp. TaxID=35761 RepID=UPI0027360290|nr:hypothetical protein [Nocardioides sp.]MDP3890909.1 hypothetical protein [Nocardioides sp.]
MADNDGRPVLSGIAALVGVGLVVGLILGFATLGATKLLGVGGSSGTSSGQATSQETLYLPTPQPTESAEGPSITLAPPDEGGDTTGEDEPTEEPTEETTEKEISLSAGQTSVGSMERIDLTGVYPGGEGSILMVQRMDSGSWVDFNVTVSVSGETFTTYIQTGRPGENRFRVRDTDSRLVSNVVRITVG